MSVTVLRRWKDQVTNFLKQKTRIEKQSSIAKKKSEKNGIFKSIALRLIDVGGGNSSSLTCSGSAESNGAKQLENLTRALGDCKKNIIASCSPENFPKANKTLVVACNKSVHNFEEEAQRQVKFL